MRFIKVADLSFSYRHNVPVFRDISFTITAPGDKGHVVGVMGNSGCGKTTLLKLLLGIETSYTGSIVTGPDHPVLSYVPQIPVLFDHLSPVENARYFQRIRSRSKSFDEELFNVLTDTLNLKDVLQSSNSVNELSGGQQQKISLARALSIRPNYLLMDEPLTGLDSQVKEHFLTTLLEIAQELRIVIVYVSHHGEEIRLVSNDIIYLMNDNKDGVSTIFQKPVQDFVVHPPCLSAAKAFRDVTYNIMSIRNDNSLLPSIASNISSLSEDCYYLGYSADSITFHEVAEIEVTLVSQTPSYTVLKLRDGGQFIRIETRQYVDRNPTKSTYLNIGPPVDQYNRQGVRIQDKDGV